MAKKSKKVVADELESEKPELSEEEAADEAKMSAEAAEAELYEGGHAVKLKRHSGEGLYRAGLHFPKGELKKFKAGELSADKLAMLIAEPKLEVFHL